MSGQARLTAYAAAATLLTACALLPLATPKTWLVQAALLVAAQSAVGALARRVPLARALTVTVQAVASLLLLTFVFAREQAELGLLPGSGALRVLGELLGQGVQDVGQYATPAPVTDGIRLLLLGGVLVIALVVDALAVTYRSTAPAGLPLLALYSVASGLARGGGRWLWFLLAAGGYLLLLLAEERDRLSRWGRVFGSGSHRPRQPPGTSGAAVAPMRTGRRIGAVALGIALIAPAALPAIDGGLLTPGAGGGFGPGGGTITAVNPLISLQDSLNQPDNREVLRYKTTSTDVPDMYLRILTLDEFDGTSWRASERRVADVPDPLPAPAGLSPAVRTSPVTTSIAAAPGYAQTYLPMPYPAHQVRVAGTWRYEAEGRTLVGDRGQTASGLQYQISSLQVQPTAQQLAEALPPPNALRQEYTQVPASLPAQVRQEAQQVTQGATNAYEQAVRLQDWFTTTGGFTYDTQVQEGSGTDAIARFLRDKRGFCVHFAFTMAAMARTLGIPARVDVGFVPGSLQPDNSWSVGLKDAHAWPELYFQGVGWTRFEPTPSRGTTPSYTRTDSPAAGNQDLSQPQRGATAAPFPSASTFADCGAAQRHANDCGTTAPAIGGGPTAGGGPSGGTLVELAGAAVLLVLGAVPMVWRRRSRAVRLAADGGTAGALAAWRELVDTAWDYGVAPDDSETPRRASDRIIRSAALPPAAAESARRVASAVEQALYAPQPSPATHLADDVRLVRDSLHAQAGRLGRLRAICAPPSARRLVWRWYELQTALAALRRSAGQRVILRARRAAAAVRLTGPRT